MSDKFSGATYYSCDDSCEVLTHESPEEAILDHLDLYATRDQDVRSQIAEIGSLTVFAYEREEVSKTDMESFASGTAEQLADWWQDNFGNPDDFPPDLDMDAYSEFEAGVVELTKKFVEKNQVWACIRVASREFSKDEMLKIAANSDPDLFREKST